MREAEIASYNVFTLTCRCRYIYIYIYIYLFVRKKYRLVFPFSLRNGQLSLADQIIRINNIYLDSYDYLTLVNHTDQLLRDSSKLSIELVIIRTTGLIDYSYAAVSSSIRNGHSCMPILSTPFNVDMVVSDND